MMNIDYELLHHPYWADVEPSTMNLVRVSRPLPLAINPLYKKVDIRIASVPGSQREHSKIGVGSAGILHYIKQGRIHQDTKVTEATSLRTGHDMALACLALGLEFHPVYNFDTPESKIRKMIGIGQHVRPHPHQDPDMSAVDVARRLGAQDGWCNPDQYGPDGWNENFQEIVALQWFGQVIRKPRIVFIPGGTMGSSKGAYKAAKLLGLNMEIHPVLVAPGQEWPGGRTLAKVKRDVRNGWEEFFPEESLRYAPRLEAIYLSYLSWPYTILPLGISFGAALYAALHHVFKLHQEGALDQYADPKDGKVHVHVFAPDGHDDYVELYKVLTHEVLARRVPVTFESLFCGM
jgi:cysteine synthase